MPGDRSRLAQWRSLLGIGWRRVTYRLGSGGNRQTVVSVLGVAIPVAMLLLVASVGVGLGTVSGTGGDVDYWIVPEGSQSAVTPVESAKLGNVHEVSERLGERDDIEFVTPMLIEFLVATDDDSREYLLAIGVIPAAEYPNLAPLSTASLTDDRFRDDGDSNVGDSDDGGDSNASDSDDGRSTGGVVLSESAAQSLSVGTGDTVAVQGGAGTLTVTSVEPPHAPGLTQFPIAVLHLSDLQALTGADDHDVANQLLVVAPAATQSTEAALGSVYAHTTVEREGGILAHRFVDSALPMAMAVAAGLSALVAGVLLVCTSFGFELIGSSRQRATMAAMGISARGRTAILGTELGVVSLYGGVIGVCLWVLGLLGANRVAIDAFGVPVAAFDPLLPVLGLGTALAIGLLSFPYLLLVDRWHSGTAFRR